MKPKTTPALFALQTKHSAPTPNHHVTRYERQLSARLNLDPRDVYLSSGGTTTPNGDSSEDS